MIAFTKTVGVVAAMAAVILTACTWSSAPTPDWEPVSPEIKAFASVCGELMDAEPEEEGQAKDEWITSLQATQPPPELVEFWEARVQQSMDRNREEPWYMLHDALSAMTHGEREVMADSGCLGLLGLNLGPIADEARERLEAGFGQRDNVTHTEYASACADIFNTLPSNPAEKATYVTQWLEQLRPPDDLESLHQAMERYYRQLQPIGQFEHPPGSDAHQSSMEALREASQAADKEVEAQDTFTREMLTQIGCL